MPFKKQPYNWQRVKAGDIISFNYKYSRAAAKKNYGILVLNPRIPVVRKDGSQGFHLTGIRLSVNKVPKVRVMTGVIRILERIGEFKAVNYEDDIFNLEINKTYLISEIKGLRNTGFNKISTMERIKSNYRTFDYYGARKSGVFLETMKVSEKENYKPKEVIVEEKTEIKKEQKKLRNKEKETKPTPTGKKAPKTGKKTPSDNKTPEIKK